MASANLWLAAVSLSVAALISSVEPPVIAFFVSAAPRGDDLFGLVCVGGMVVFTGWVIAAIIMQNTAIRPAEISRTHLLLAGVSDTFVQAVEEMEIERRVRLRQFEQQDRAAELPRRSSSAAIQDDYPPRPTAPPDAIQE